MKILALIVGVMFSFPVLLSNQSADAYEIIYPILDYKHKKIPNYCILRSADPQFNDGQKDWMVKVTQDAIREWETTLQESLSHSYKWQMMSTQIETKSQSDSFNCDWIISFEAEIPTFFFFGKVLGYADIEKQEIVVTFKELDPEQFHDVLLHEIGHSIGLGHFTTDDNEVMYDWLTSETPPSIMIPNIHQNPGLTYITDVDIDKVKSIYGTGGFLGEYEEEREESEIQPLTAINAIDDLEISPEKIIVKKHQNNMLTISGKLKSDYLLSGVPLYLLIIKPDLSTDVLTIYPTSKGNFQTNLIYDEKSPIGEYSIEAVYLDRTVNYQSAKYIVINENFQLAVPEKNVQKPKNIPAWIKNNAKWWSEDLVDDKSFINGIQYLLENEIITIPNLEVKTKQTTKEIPGWIKSNAAWWANGKISDDEFLKGLQYLVRQGIIRV
jgi:hypothetical protein